MIKDLKNITNTIVEGVEPVAINNSIDNCYKYEYE